jgi:WD40 repeat protein
MVFFSWFDMNIGTILEIDDKGEGVTLLNSHNHGAIVGLEVVEKDYVLTTGEDNQLILWDTNEHRSHKSVPINPSTKSKKEEYKGFDKEKKFCRIYSNSEESRCVSFNSHTLHIAIGTNDGMLYIRNSYNEMDNIIKSFQVCSEMIECLKYSPCGTKLAAGAHDFKIYVYSVRLNKRL